MSQSSCGVSSHLKQRWACDMVPNLMCTIVHIAADVYNCTRGLWPDTQAASATVNPCRAQRVLVIRTELSLTMLLVRVAGGLFTPLFDPYMPCWIVCSRAAVAARSQLTGKHALPLCGLQALLTFVGGLTHEMPKCCFHLPIWWRKVTKFSSCRLLA